MTITIGKITAIDGPVGENINALPVFTIPAYAASSWLFPLAGKLKSKLCLYLVQRTSSPFRLLLATISFGKNSFAVSTIAFPIAEIRATIGIIADTEPFAFTIVKGTNIAGTTFVDEYAASGVAISGNTLTYQ